MAVGEPVITLLMFLGIWFGMPALLLLALWFFIDRKHPAWGKR